MFVIGSYMRPTRKGDTISVAAEAECLKIGKTMAFVSVDILSKSDGNKLKADRQQNFTDNIDISIHSYNV